ncbi:hypothetical protein PIB30_035568 [Stylosanthes scabra]|uniref:Uncharacterized protein n=1 Tax=Stylosanthes scabra TaxID=79078 RepID=A0ABU6UF47_9FABA|nr:hypothetical protein [Stylosanthes scabra]
MEDNNVGGSVPKINGSMQENSEKSAATNNDATNKHYEKKPSSHFVFGNNHSSKVEELPKAHVKLNGTANNQVNDAIDVVNKEEKEKGWTPVSKKKAKIKRKVDSLGKPEYISSELGTMQPNFFHMGRMKFQPISKGESSRTNKDFPGLVQNKSAPNKLQTKATISKNSSPLNQRDTTVTPATPFRKRDRPPSLQGSPNLTDPDGPNQAQQELVEESGLGNQEPQALLMETQSTDTATVNA